MVYVNPGSEYGPNWNKRRWIIFKSVGYICQLCGEYSKGNLHLHHIRPIGCGGSNASNNIVAVCQHCHSFIHSGKYRGMYLNLSRCGKK